MLSRKSGSLTGQLLRRVMTLSLIAVVSLLAAGGAGLLLIQVVAQRDLNRSGSNISHTFDVVIADIISDMQAIGNAPQDTSIEPIFRNMFVSHPGVFEMLTMDLQGNIILQTNLEGSSAIANGEQVTEQPWLETIQTGNTYIGSVELSDSGVTYIDIAIPVVDETGAAAGTVVGRFNLAPLGILMGSLHVGETGYAYVVDRHGQIMVAKNLELVQNKANINDLVGHSPESIVDGSILGLFNFYTGIEDKRVAASAYELTIVPWYTITEQPYQEALGGSVPLLVILLVALIVLIVLIYGIVRYVRQSVAAPLRDIAEGLQVFRSGDLSYAIKPSGSRELRELTATINEIAHELNRSSAELAEANQTLEQRVTERSRDLATLAQVTSQTATILDARQLLQAVVDLTKTNFSLYHAHVYLLDDSGTTLELAAGSGEVGKILVTQGHRIGMQSARSLVASAARTQSVVTVNNVSVTPDFLPNPLLPQTQSELAAALVARGQLLGVLDVQSEETGHFGPELQTVMRTLAHQIAAALSNARLYGESERVSRQEVAISAITQQMQGAVSIEDVLQTAARELGKALRVPHTTIALQLSENPPEVQMPSAYDTDMEVTPR